MRLKLTISPRARVNRSAKRLLILMEEVVHEIAPFHQVWITYCYPGPLIRAARVLIYRMGNELKSYNL